LPGFGDRASGCDVGEEVGEPRHCPAAGSGDPVSACSVGVEEGMPPLHGVQGKDACHTPSLLMKVMGERGGWQTEEPHIRGMQEGGKGGRKGVTEDLEDSLRHLAFPKHVRLASQSSLLEVSLLGHTLCIGESGARPESSEGGRQLVLAAGALEGNVMPPRGLDPIDLEAPGGLFPLAGASFEVPHLVHPLEQRLELCGGFCGGGGGEGVDNVLQASLMLPLEDRRKEHLGRPSHRGAMHSKGERLGVGRWPVELSDVSIEGKGSGSHSSGGGEEAENGKGAEVGKVAGGGAEGSKGDTPTAEGT